MITNNNIRTYRATKVMYVNNQVFMKPSDIVTVYPEGTVINHTTAKIAKDDGECRRLLLTGDWADALYEYAPMVVDKEKIKTTTQVEDKVNKPSHYTWLADALKKRFKVDINPIHIIELFNFNRGNILKYTVRAGYKKEEGYDDKEKEIEDLKKVIFYANQEIERITNG
jgi:hypothetical protein